MTSINPLYIKATERIKESLQEFRKGIDLDADRKTMLEQSQSMISDIWDPNHPELSEIAGRIADAYMEEYDWDAFLDLIPYHMQGSMRLRDAELATEYLVEYGLDAIDDEVANNLSFGTSSAMSTFMDLYTNLKTTYERRLFAKVSAQSIPDFNQKFDEYVMKKSKEEVNIEECVKEAAIKIFARLGIEAVPVSDAEEFKKILGETDEKAD